MNQLIQAAYQHHQIAKLYSRVAEEYDRLMKAAKRRRYGGGWWGAVASGMTDIAIMISYHCWLYWLYPSFIGDNDGYIIYHLLVNDG